MQFYRVGLIRIILEFVSVKGGLYTKAIRARSTILTAISNVMTYASLAAPIHAAWGVDVYKFRDNCQSLFSHGDMPNNQ